MAKLLNNGTDLKNYTEYPNTFRRQGAFPLDAYSLFKSYDEAQAYALSNKYAYVGQVLSVVENNTVKQYIITANGKLRLNGGSSTKETNFSAAASEGIKIETGVLKVKFSFFFTSHIRNKLRLKFITENNIWLWNLGERQYKNGQGEIEIEHYVSKDCYSVKYQLGEWYEDDSKVFIPYESGKELYEYNFVLSSGKFYIEQEDEVGWNPISNGTLQIEETFSN